MGHRIQFLKGTNEGPFNQSLAPNGASSFREDLNFFPIALIVKTTSYDGSQLGWQAGSSDTIPKEDHIGLHYQSLVPIGQAVSNIIPYGPML